MADSLSRRQVIGIGAAVAGAAVAAPILANTARAGTGAPAAGAGHAVSVNDLPWQAARDIVNGIVPTSFPDATFEVTKFGAKADGKTDNTAAFAAAIVLLLGALLAPAALSFYYWRSL